MSDKNESPKIENDTLALAGVAQWIEHRPAN